MADNVVEQPAANPVVDEAKQALDNQMNIALKGYVPEPEKKEPPTPEGAAQPAVVINPFDTIKEKFGYQTYEDAIKDIEELRAFKATPPTAELQFENEESERLVKALAKGDRKTVLEIYAKQDRIDNLTTLEVNKDTAADIVKYGMQLKYKDLSPTEINYRFNKQFGIPPKPTQQTDEEVQDYQTRVTSWEAVVADKEMELMIEAKLAKPELELAKTKLVIPDIDAPTDEGYLQYQTMLKESDRLADEAKAMYKTFSPKTIETILNFKDEANKIDFQFQFEPDAESFNKSIENTADMNVFWSNFYTPEGKPDRQKFARFVYNGLNFDKILMAAMNQSKNAAIKSMLPDNSKEGGLLRQMPASQEGGTELDKKMKQALHGFL